MVEPEVTAEILKTPSALFGVAYGKLDSIFSPSVGLLLGYFSQIIGERMKDTKLVTKSVYLENLQKEIGEKFDRARVLAVKVKPALTLDEKAEVLFAVALRKCAGRRPLLESQVFPV
jgi:hypothetical protein